MSRHKTHLDPETGSPFYPLAHAQDGAAKVNGLGWLETSADRGDGSSEFSGFEAETPFGTWYLIEIENDHFTVEHDLTEIGRADSPDLAKEIAQRDFEQRIAWAMAPGAHTCRLTPAASEVERLKDANDYHDHHPLTGFRKPAGAEDVIKDAWETLEDHGFPPEACSYLPAAIDNAISCMAETREDLIKQRDHALALVEDARAALKTAEVRLESALACDDFVSGHNALPVLEIIRAALTSTMREGGQ